MSLRHAALPALATATLAACHPRLQRRRPTLRSQSCQVSAWAGQTSHCAAASSAPPPHTPQRQGDGWQDGMRAQHMAIFTSEGRQASMSEVVKAVQDAEVLLLGETHDDPVAHQLELYLLITLQQQRSCSLSMEMFETDVQPILDEYLAGAIREEDFLRDSRAWGNYLSDYRLLMEFAKDVGMPVIAANAPRRYVSIVGRYGLAALSLPGWPKATFSWLPPLPLPEPTIVYMDHLTSRPGRPSQSESSGPEDGCPFMHKPEDLVDPVVLWDCGMAHSIARHLEQKPGQLVYHVCGCFHVERFVGVGEMLRHYRPGTRTLVIAMYPEIDCHTYDPAVHAGQADFVILTDASLPRSHEYFPHATK